MGMNSIFLSVLLIAFLSCENVSKNTKHAVVQDTLTTEEFRDAHTSMNALDWIGTYVGLLPCADCQGIQVQIVLNQDGTFSAEQEYLKSPNMIVRTKGVFTWDLSGSKISLKDDRDFTQSFKVMENALMQLDTQGKEIKGNLAEHYILKKK